METEQQQQQEEEEEEQPAPAASLQIPVSSPPPPPPSPRPQRRVSVSYRVTVAAAADHAPAGGTRTCASEDACYCFTVLSSFWFFASLTVILGFYGSVDLQLGPSSSWLLKANSVFVQGIKVEAVDGSKAAGAALYGFFHSPPLDISTSWSETYNLSIAASLHQEFSYYLNEGAQIDITYHVRAPRTSPLILAISRGKESLIEWIEDPSYDRGGALSWNLIYGDGSIRQAISKTWDYYISLGNNHQETVEVFLNISIRALLYNTSNAYYTCSINRSSCVMNLFPFVSDAAAVLTTPGGEEIGEWGIKVSYNPRWITYFAGSAAVTMVIVLAWKLISHLRPNPPPPAAAEAGIDERTPLLDAAANKDDDEQSLGSSYDSVSSDEAGGHGDHQRTEAGDGDGDRPQQLCAVCFDALKESFFLPCGHCATCFACGTRISEEDGICPICRRKVKKVRRIITV